MNETIHTFEKMARQSGKEISENGGKDLLISFHNFQIANKRFSKAHHIFIKP